MLLVTAMSISGCSKTTKEKEGGVINPFSPSSMVNTYDNSKKKINDTVQKENEKLNDALKEGEINN